jgi:alkaline phosphatase D
MMLWLGDNIYLREADWFSRTGIYHRYTHGRSIPEVQALLASVSQYAIWDDHDYGPNDSDRTYRDKAITLEAFKDFWANPPYGMNGEKGITTMFEWGDAQFFLLDNRSYRNPNYMRTAEKTILGREQLDWLIESLASSTARFKFVCIGGQVLNSATVFENYINLAPGERDEILDRIFAEGIKNVIFLTGDRHHSEMSKLSRNGITLYDFTVSPLTAGTHDAVDEKNQYRMEGSHLSDRNFGIIEISGERTARKVKFSLIDEDGKVRWTTEIKAE